MTLDSTHEFAPAGFDINKAGTRLPKIAILDRWTRIPRTNPLLAISRVVDTCSISTGDGWTEGRGKWIRGSNHLLDTVSCLLRYDQGLLPDQPHRDRVYTPTGDTRIDEPTEPEE